MVLIPVFLATIFLILQASLWIHASTVAQAAASDGVRAGTAWGGTPQVAQAEAEQILAQRRVGTNWTVTGTNSDTFMTLTVTGQALSVIPGWTWKVEESARLPVNGAG